MQIITGTGQTGPSRALRFSDRVRNLDFPESGLSKRCHSTVVAVWSFERFVGCSKSPRLENREMRGAISEWGEGGLYCLARPGPTAIVLPACSPVRGKRKQDILKLLNLEDTQAILRLRD